VDTGHLSGCNLTAHNYGLDQNHTLSIVMNDEEFKQKLSEVAEWEIPKLTPTDIREAKKSARGKHKRTEEELYQIEHEELFLEIFNGINPTMQPQIIKVKCQACTCEDCGMHCENGRQKEKKLCETNRTRHWREKCVTCGKSKNPYTGKFDLDSGKVGIEWNQYLRDKKAQKKSHSKNNEIVTYTHNHVIKENDQEIITIYTGHH
jgi:hypothetical protein